MISRSLTALLLAGSLFSTGGSIPKPKYEFELRKDLEKSGIDLSYALDKNGNQEVDEGETLNRTNRRYFGKDAIIRIGISTSKYSGKKISGILVHVNQRVKHDLPERLVENFEGEYLPIFEFNPTPEEELKKEGLEFKTEKYILFILHNGKPLDSIHFDINYQKREAELDKH